MRRLPKARQQKSTNGGALLDTPWGNLVSEETLHRVARIMGQSSAAADAIKDVERRKAAGEDVVILVRGSAWLVVNLDAN